MFSKTVYSAVAAGLTIGAPAMASNPVRDFRDPAHLVEHGGGALPVELIDRQDLGPVYPWAGRWVWRLGGTNRERTGGRSDETHEERSTIDQRHPGFLSAPWSMG